MNVAILYSIHPKLLDTFNKSLCLKLNDLFLIYPNLEFFLKIKPYRWKETLLISLDSKFQLILTFHDK
jgi:hypothetical protein